MGGRGSSFGGGGNEGTQRERYGGGNDNWFIKATVEQPTTNREDFAPDGKLKLDKHKINVYENTDAIENTLLKNNVEKVLDVQANLKLTYNIDLEKSLDDGALGLYAGQTKQRVIAAYSGDKIAFNKEYYGSEQKLVETKARSIKSGHSARCDKDNYNVYTSIHEYGHFVQDHIIKKRLARANKEYNWENQKREAKAIRLEILDINKKQYNSDSYRISNYGLENSMEFFAEAFAESQLSSRRTTLSESLLVFLGNEGLKEYGQR